MSEAKDKTAGEFESVAIIGMSGRFPGADSLYDFWRNLRNGVEAVSFFTEEELLASGLSLDEISQPNYVRAKPILSDIQTFDAEFFRMSPKEAALTDPQHRIFLECAWEALEDAAHNPHTHKGRIALFAAASKNTYLLFNLLRRSEWLRTEEVYQVLIGNEKDYLTSRVSYKLNLRGPSVTVQTACSSSLVAVHMACQSLLNGECDIALAGGVSIDVPHKAGYLYHAGDVLSPDGHCRAFDASAHGTIFGQGAGVVVLRRLSDAVEDGDCVRALIRGSAVNNDGSLKVGFTAPSVGGQAEVISEALAVADVRPETISYVEAHGTATKLGDPIEVEALTKAFRTKTNGKQYCALGSVKTNIGHLNAAAGIAGLIKTVLALKHKQIPPSLHFREPNEGINFDASPFFVNSTLTDWERTSQHPRRAGVSSFGQGGTNAHVVLEEAPLRATTLQSRRDHVLPISARSASALDIATRKLHRALAEDASLNIADVAFTLQMGRHHFPHRRVILCRDLGEAVRALDDASALDSGPDQQGDGRETDNRVAALGEQWLRGVDVDWQALYADAKPLRVPLPTYPFERQRCWVEPEQSRDPDARYPPSPFSSVYATKGSAERAGVLLQSLAFAQPSNSTERLLCQIFESTLGLRQVGVDDNFFQLGGHSLIAMSLISDISETLAVELPITVIFDKPTVRELAEFLDSGPGRQQIERGEPIDLRAEVFLDDSIQVETGLPSVSATPENIFLTGATGFVGAHLLAELILKTDARIHCMVRATTVAEAGERIRRTLLLYGLWREESFDRIRPVPGNLAQALFGMSAGAFRELAAQTDAIYHCGAQVNFVQSYQTLKRANVGGTEEALRFAVTEKLKPAHHISSIAVFDSDDFAGVSLAGEDDDLKSGAGFRVGYNASKWVAERLVNIARERGAQVSVYRPSNVSGHSGTGVMPDRHIIARFIKGCLQLGLVPAEQEAVNIIPADVASRMIVELSLRPETLGGNFHVVNPRQTSLGQVIEWLQTRGYRLRPCGYEEWLQAIKDAPAGNELKPFLPMLNQGALFSGRRYDYANTARYLSRSPIENSPVDDRLLDTYLSYLIRHGYIEEPSKR